MPHHQHTVNKNKDKELKNHWSNLWFQKELSKTWNIFFTLTSTFSWQENDPDVFNDFELDVLTVAAGISFICQVGTEKINIYISQNYTKGNSEVIFSKSFYDYLQ